MNKIHNPNSILTQISLSFFLFPLFHVPYVEHVEPLTRGDPVVRIPIRALEGVREGGEEADNCEQSHQDGCDVQVDRLASAAVGGGEVEGLEG